MEGIEIDTKSFIKNNKKTIGDFSKKIDKIKKSNKQYSHLFNPLRFFDIGEVTHSFLLAKLLNPYAEHGQRDRFLKVFLDQIGIKYNENDKWIVTAEKGRIDVLIKSTQSVIIIENKSHHAKDEKNQLYRYWYREMFLPNEDKPINHTLGIENEYYRIVYLVSDDNKEPKPNSLQRPEGWALNEKLKSLDKLHNIHIQKMSFDKDVVKWLETCKELLDQKNYRLKEYLLQYIELCKNINNKKWKKNL